VTLLNFTLVISEGVIEGIILVHAINGGIALVSGALALASKKGSSFHKKSGLVFYCSMLAAAVLALIIAVMPGHENPFLFSIGLFSSYFLITGLRSLKYRQPDYSLTVDKVLALLLILTGLFMIFYPLVLDNQFNVVLLVFGIAGIISGFRDYVRLRKGDAVRSHWLPLHLGKMTGGYIAAVTAFFVVNKVLPGVWNWFAPSVVGSVFIAYWIRRVKRGTIKP